MDIILRIAICDDDKFICQRLEQLIVDYATHIATKLAVEVFCRGEDLMGSIQREHPFDLIFLDIELVTTTGIDIGHIIRNELNDHICKIVFISGAGGYDRQLFKLQPFDFLEKPVDPQRLYHCIDLATQILGSENKQFVYKAGHSFMSISTKEILYFESSLRKIKMVTTSGETFFNATLSEIQSKLPTTFIAPHGSFLINFAHVISIGITEITMTNGATIFVSRRNMSVVRDMQIQLAKEKLYNV